MVLHRAFAYSACISAGLGVSVSDASSATFNDNWISALAVQTFMDARTDDNQTSVGEGEFRWNIDAGADVFSQEQYERPTGQMDEALNGAPAAKKYYQQLDIVSGLFALDPTSQHAYFAINLVGTQEVDQSGSTSDVGFDQFYRV